MHLKVHLAVSFGSRGHLSKHDLWGIGWQTQLLTEVELRFTTSRARSSLLGLTGHQELHLLWLSGSLRVKHLP